jgi:hypothetical protein
MVMKNEHWRRIFNDKNASVYLKELLQFIDVNNIETKLQERIDNYPESIRDWKSLLIHNTGIIESCKQYPYKYRIARWGNKIALSRSYADTWSWSRNAELYSFVLFKSRLEGKQFLPFKGTDYWISGKYEPCAIVN